MPRKPGLVVELCKIHLKFKTGVEKQRPGEAEECLRFPNRSKNTLKKKIPSVDFGDVRKLKEG